MTPGVPVMELTLDDAIQIALEKNLDLQVAKMNPLIQDYNLVQARAAYKPTLTGTFNQNHASSQSTNRLDGVTSVNITQTQAYNLGAEPAHAVVRRPARADVQQRPQLHEQREQHASTRRTTRHCASTTRSRCSRTSRSTTSATR